jgi:5-methylcytosine-specific restriction protein A
MPDAPQFTIGQEYRRRDLHAKYGGQRQGGISTPQRFPILLLFTGESGEQYGYSDGFQEDGTFWYTGEGQVGDMEMVRGNRAIRDHEADGKALHLFESTRTAWVRYLGEASYLGVHDATAPDHNGKFRRALVFELALDDRKSEAVVPDLRVESERPSAAFRGRDLAELRAAALAGASGTATARERRAIVRRRSEAVRIYVRKRASGKCEGCGEAAPFLTPAKQPYLEPHHIRRLADGGPDHPRWVAALCPTCHRRVHHGADGKEWNQAIADRIGALEGI